MLDIVVQNLILYSVIKYQIHSSTCQSGAGPQNALAFKKGLENIVFLVKAGAFLVPAVFAVACFGFT